MRRRANTRAELANYQIRLTQFVERLELNRQGLQANLASTNAAVERLERIIGYLIRRDGESRGEQQE